MKIDKLKINGFGKLQDKSIDFCEGINVVSGKNESGKSSLLKFIASMLYGTSRNKNGKDISDFDRFKPWQVDDFSGKISYTLDNGEYYEVYREFKKKNPVIYNEAKDDISKTFIIDKAKGICFFEDQTGIDEETFYNTAINEQEGIKLSKTAQTTIIQKISNLILTGDDKISFKKSLDRLNKRQNEIIGTERTFQRPINIMNNKINRLVEEKQRLETYKEGFYDNSIEKEQLESDKQEEEMQKELLKEIKLKLDNSRLKNAEIDFNKNLEDEYSKKIEELNRKIENQDVKEKYGDINLRNYYISLIVFIIFFLVLLIFSNMKLLSLIVLIPALFVIYKILKARKENKNFEEEKEENLSKIIGEIEVLKENIEKKKAERTEKQEELEKEIEKEKELLIGKYSSKVDEDFINENMDKSYDEILKEIDRKERRISSIEFKLQTMENSNKEINLKLDNLSKLEEELQDLESEKEELLSLNNSYNIAKACLENAYNKVKENISPKFVENLCKIISQVSSGRYKNIVVNDEDGIKVEVDNGNYIPVSRLSVGTIDQMYLSLRLSALSEISKEKMPIIFDETFVYFDDERLKNILKYLSKNYSDNQIIILSCSKREIDLLNKLKIDYNEVKF